MTSITEWEKEGFGSPPASNTSIGGEELMRAFSPMKVGDAAGNRYGSNFLSNCFFVFRKDVDGTRIRSVTRNDLAAVTAETLEANLNAALWGNTFQQLQIFSMPAGIRYKIGPIGHDIRTAESFKALDPATGNVEQVEGIARSQSFLPVASDCMQVVLADRGDLGRLIPVGQPLKIPGRERFSGPKSGLWH